MKQLFILLLMFGFFCLGSPPKGWATYKSSYETVTKAKSYAIAMPEAYENAVFAKVFVHAGESRAAAISQVASLSNTPIVEVRARTTIGGRSYKRLCDKLGTPFIHVLIAATAGHQLIHTHIDPGLTIC